MRFLFENWIFELVVSKVINWGIWNTVVAPLKLFPYRKVSVTTNVISVSLSELILNSSGSIKNLFLSQITSNGLRCFFLSKDQ